MRAPGWAKQTTAFMTSQLPGTKHYIPTHRAIHIACLAFISQAKQISKAPYVASESDAALYRDHPPPTTACLQFDHQLIIGYGNSTIGYKIIRVSHLQIKPAKYIASNQIKVSK